MIRGAPLRFLGALLILLLALALSLKMELFLGWSFDIVLALLIAFATLLSIEETVLLTGFAALVLNWRPGFTSELILFLAVPVFAALFKAYLPWRKSFTPAILTALGILGLYSISSTLSAARAFFMITDLAISIAVGYLVLAAFGWAWGKRSGSRFLFA